MSKLFESINLKVQHLSKSTLGLLFFVLTLLYYGNSLSNGYSLDDEFIYTSNSIATNGLSDISRIFTENSFDYGNYKFGYRPIAILSFAIENQIFGVNSTVSHLINLLLYAGCSWLFFMVLQIVFPKENRFYLFLSVLLFLVLPIHSEIANNIKCRDELLMLFFGLSGLLFWVRDSKKFGNVLVGLLFIVASILSKKTGLIFLGIIPLSIFFKSDGAWKKSIISIGIMVVPFVLFRLVARQFKEGKGKRVYDFVENPLFGGELTYNKLTIILESNWFYLKNLMLPTEFISYYGYKTLAINGYRPAVFVGAAILIILAALSLRVFKERNTYLFGLIVLLVGLLPFLNATTPMVGIVAERFITVASMGFCVFVVFGLSILAKRFKPKKAGLYVFMFVLIYGLAYLPVIWSRNSQWESKLTVMEADLEKTPENVILNSNLASNYSSMMAYINQRQRMEYANRIIKFTKKANTLYPMSENYFLLGSTQYIVFKDFQSAEKNLLKALQMDPTHFGTMLNLANIYKEVKQPQKSIQYLKLLLQVYPKDVSSYALLARKLAEQGRFEEALLHTQEGIAVNGEQYDLVLSMGNIYYMQRDATNTVMWYKKVLSQRPKNGEIRQRLTKLQQYNPELR